MKLLAWWKDWRNARVAGMAHYQRGMLLENEHDAADALESYTAAIELSNTPDAVRAMALYNRALLYAARKDLARAEADLKKVLDMRAPLRKIKSAAWQKLDRMQHTTHSAQSH